MYPESSILNLYLAIRENPEHPAPTTSKVDVSSAEFMARICVSQGLWIDQMKCQQQKAMKLYV